MAVKTGDAFVDIGADGLRQSAVATVFPENAVNGERCMFDAVKSQPFPLNVGFYDKIRIDLCNIRHSMHLLIVVWLTRE